MVSEVGFGQWLSAAWSPLPTNPPLQWPRPRAWKMSPISITCHKLNGCNFLPWSQSVMMFIYSQGKEDIVMGTATRPDSSDAKFKHGSLQTIWSCHGWLIPWRLRLEKFSSLLHCQRYLGCVSRNTLQDKTLELFATESTIHDLCQEESIVTAYFSALTRHWHIIDMTTWLEVHHWRQALPIHHWKETCVQFFYGPQ